MRPLFAQTETEALNFLFGDIWEIARLFGGELALLPEEDVLRGHQPGEPVNVELPLELGRLTSAYVDAIYYLLEERGVGTLARRRFEGAEGELYQVLERLLVNALGSERRNGLHNLFWLAYSRSLAQLIEDYYTQPNKKIVNRYRMHPLLGGLLRTVMGRAMERAGPGHIPQGWETGRGLVSTVIHDQFPLTEVHIKKLDLSLALSVRNRRYPLPHRVFTTIYAALKARLKSGLSSQERGLMMTVRRALPFLHRPQAGDSATVRKLLFNTDVVTYLLLDPEGALKAIFREEQVRTAIQQLGTWSDVVATYLEILEAIKRTEVLEVFRKRIRLVIREVNPSEEFRLFAEGRLYRYGEFTQIVNSARIATILFVDLRGFTRVAEGGVSEKELTHELYLVFDPFVRIVERFGGRVDKFMGDGMMVTFGIPHPKPDDPLNALRASIEMQQALTRLRHKDKSAFQTMGISLNTGRVFVADFLLGREGRQTTVIGRNVNIAGRLSSPKGPVPPEEQDEFREMVHSLVSSLSGTPEGEGFARYVSDRYEPQRRTVAGVAVDSNGRLTNTGIALSQDALEAIRQVVRLTESGKERGFMYEDPVLRRQVVFQYVGDAVLEGVDATCPVYSVKV